jgi:hypothetical protein
MWQGPSTEVISFDWNSLMEPRLPSYLSLQIIMQVCNKIKVHNIVVEKGASVRILSSTAWKAMGSPKLVSTTHNLWDFNRIPSEYLWILPQLPITLGGKIVFIDVMIVHKPLDFNFLLGREYVYTMKVVMSTLFRVIHFPHNGTL